MTRHHTRLNTPDQELEVLKFQHSRLITDKCTPVAPRPASIRLPEVERWLDHLYVAAEGASLRQEDRRKAQQVAAMLDEIARAMGRFSRRWPLFVVDAAAGKSYVGLLAAKLVLEPMGRDARVIALERDAHRVAASRRAIERLQSSVPIECREADVCSPEAWPPEPSLVVALHACGTAADAVIAGAIATRARALLLVPCCTNDAVSSALHVDERAEQAGIPRHAPIRRRFVQALVDADRTWRLEAAGYETEVVEFVGPTLTPHNLLWRSRRVGEPRRMQAARRARSLAGASE